LKHDFLAKSQAAYFTKKKESVYETSLKTILAMYKMQFNHTTGQAIK